MNNPTTKAEFLTYLGNDDNNINKVNYDLILKHLIDNVKPNIVISTSAVSGTVL